MISIGDVAALVSGIGTLALALVAYKQLRDNRGLIEATKSQAQAAESTAKENRALIEATAAQARAAQEQARASLDQAMAMTQLVEEVRVDRELAWRPWLTIQSYTKPAIQLAGTSNQTYGPPELTKGLSPLSTHVQLTVENIGRGLAINCRYIGYYSIPAEEMDMFPRNDRFVGGRAYYKSDVFQLGAGSTRTLQARQVVADGTVTAAIHGTEFSGKAAEVNLLLCVDQFGRTYRFELGKLQPDTWPALPLSDHPFPESAPTWTQAV